MINRSRSALALSLATILVAACGGAASPSPVVTGNAPTSPASAAPSTPAVTPTGGESEPPAGGPDLDLGAAAAALEEIDSYRLTMSVGGAAASTVEATIVRQPEPAQQLAITSGGSTQNIILIGDQAWLDAGNGTYQSVPSQMVAGMARAFDPVLLLGSFSNPALAGGLETVGPEDRNGVSTTHYRLDPDSPAGQAAGLPDGAAMDLWLADEGYLVAFEGTSLDPSMSSIRFEISNVNDPTNSVEAPG
jgi:hypothetical protein